MTWIKTVKRNEGDDAQRAKLREAFRWAQMYPREYSAPVPSLAAIEKETGEGGISDAHTLLPATLYHAFALLGTLLQPDLTLSRTQQEMIATTVSVINHCFYWTESHAEFLRLASGNDALAAAIKTDYAQADLNPCDRAMLDYAAKLTRTPADMSRADVENLKAHGFDDKTVLQINLIASYFNYINRVADGLGVGRQ